METWYLTTQCIGTLVVCIAAYLCGYKIGLGRGLDRGNIRGRTSARIIDRQSEIIRELEDIVVVYELATYAINDFEANGNTHHAEQWCQLRWSGDKTEPPPPHASCCLKQELISTCRYLCERYTPGVKTSDLRRANTRYLNAKMKSILKLDTV